MDVIYQKMKTHESGYIVAPNIEDATMIHKYLKTNYPGIKAETFHSRMPLAQQRIILKKMRDGDIDYLVTVQKLDEAIDLPRMSLYIDLNRRIGPRQILQRLGRVIRLNAGKQPVEVIALFDMSPQGIIDEFSVFNSLLDEGVFDPRPNKDGERDKSEDVADKPGLVFQSGQMAEPSKRLAEVLSTKVLEKSKRIFYDESNGLVIQKLNSASRSTDEEAWDMIKDWYDEQGSLPKGPTARDSETRTEDEKFVWELMKQLGGKRIVQKRLDELNKPREEELNPSNSLLSQIEALLKEEFQKMQQKGPEEREEKPQENVAKKDPNEPKVSANEKAETDKEEALEWVRTHDEWPKASSKDFEERRMATIINTKMGGQKEVITEGLLDSPYLRLTRTDTEGRLELLHEYLIYQEEAYGNVSQVDLPAADNLTLATELSENSSSARIVGDWDLKMKKMADKLFVHLKPISNKEIVDYLKERGAIKRYPLVQLKYDRGAYFDDWIKKNKRLPKSQYAKTRQTKANAIETAMLSYYNTLSLEKKTRLKYEISLMKPSY